jgi:iron complex transport system ATP-binding protein
VVNMLRIQHVSGGYSDKPIVKDISFEVRKGEMLGILGPNGSGKTTLLKMISGIMPFSKGGILIDNKELSEYSPKELAKLVAVLPQHTADPFSYTVKETVSLGRYAHQRGWFHSWSTEDEETILRVMEQTGTVSLQHRSIQDLSGGERQRVYLAQALAQEPRILLLDEPTNHLDLSYQKELFDLLKKWTKECDLMVVSIFHDLNLAGLYCDRLLLLQEGEIVIEDTPNEVLKQERIQNVYHTKIAKQPHPKVPVPQMVLLPEWESDQEEKVVQIDQSMIHTSSERIVVKTAQPLKTMSSGVVGSGVGWYQNFVNRHVDKSYNCSDHKKEMATYLEKNGFVPGETVGMMTAVKLEDVSYKLYVDGNVSIFVVVTAGVGNAIDASIIDREVFDHTPGTINTWIFVNGELSEEAFIQSIMTATEVKVKVLQNEEVLDVTTGTFATGTSTDSILIAATQKGTSIEYAGSFTQLGRLISRGVYECTTEAIRKSRIRKESMSSSL